MNVPSFSPQPAAGKRSAICAVSVVVYISCTTKKSNFPSVRTHGLMNPRVDRIGGNDPQTANRTGVHCVENLVVAQSGGMGNFLQVDTSRWATVSRSAAFVQSRLPGKVLVSLNKQDPICCWSFFCNSNCVCVNCRRPLRLERLILTTNRMVNEFALGTSEICAVENGRANCCVLL